jgi:hypothetical protein
MKKHFSILLLFFATLTNALRADWVLKYKNSDSKKEQIMTITSKGDKLRLDLGDTMSTIVDLKLKTHTMLVHGQKMILKMDQFGMKSTGAVIRGFLGPEKSGEFKFTPTGEVEKVGDWECSVFELENDIQTGRFWISKDYPNYIEVGAVLDSVRDSMGGQSFARWPKSTEVEGMVVKSQTEWKQRGNTAVTRLVSATKTEVLDAVFSIPSNYKEMKVPGLPGMK